MMMTRHLPRRRGNSVDGSGGDVPDNDGGDGVWTPFAAFHFLFDPVRFALHRFLCLGTSRVGLPIPAERHVTFVLAHLALLSLKSSVFRVYGGGGSGGGFGQHQRATRSHFGDESGFRLFR